MTNQPTLSPYEFEMTNQPKPVSELSAEELMSQSDLRDNATDNYIEDCDCAECREVMARLREWDAAKEWGERYPASVGGGDGNVLLAAMLKAREK